MYVYIYRAHTSGERDKVCKIRKMRIWWIILVNGRSAPHIPKYSSLLSLYADQQKRALISIVSKVSRIK